jgi:hypothetical protein
MWVTVHALSGLALGTAAPLGMAWIVLCSLALHLLLDLVPHWDYTRHHLRTLWAVTDVVLSIAAVVTLTLALDLPPRAFVAAIVSALPDLDVFDAVLPGPARRRWFPSHWRRFPHGEVRAEVGIPLQAIIALGCIGGLIVTSL